MPELTPYPRPESHARLPEHQSDRARHIKRRLFMLGGGALIGPPALLGATDTTLGELYWAGTHPEAHDVYVGHERPDQPKTGIFVLPGFNVANLRHGAQAQLPALCQAGDYIGHVTYGNNGFDIRDIHRSVKDKINKHGLERVRFAAQSMGGMVALDLASRLHDDDITTDRIFFYSSPLDFTHLHPLSQRVITTLSQADAQKIRLGPMTRFGMELSRQLQDGDELPAAWDDARTIMGPEGSSNIQLQTIATYMRQFNIMDYRDALPKNLQAVYMCTSPPTQDRFVDVTKPPRVLDDGLFANHIVLKSPAVRHADITASHQAFCDMTVAAIARCDTYEYLMSLPNPTDEHGI